MLAKMTEIVSGMRVFPERMNYNLESTGGLVFSGQLLLDLVEAGAPRNDAYKWVQSHAMAAWEGGETFRERVATDQRITQYLSPEKIAHAFSLHRQLHAVDAIFDRVFA